MIRYRQSATGSCLILALICVLLPKPACADDGRQPESLRLCANPAFAPIGNLFALSEVSINGRALHGQQPIWSGDLLLVSNTASVVLDSVAKITLGPSTMARMAISSSSGDTSRPVLNISLGSGNLSVQLEPDASAYLETCESAFTTSSGAKFRVELRAGHAVTAVSRGKLTQGLITKRTYHVRLVKPVLNPNQDMEVKQRKSAGISTGVAKSETKEKKAASGLRVSFTHGANPAEVQAAVETPAPDKRVQFTLSKNIGEVTPNPATTDRDGIARVTFKAGRDIGEADITAEVLDLKRTDDEIENAFPWTGHIRVIKAGFWTRNKNKLLVAAAAVAGGVVCAFVCGPTKPLTQEPPPIIP